MLLYILLCFLLRFYRNIRGKDLSNSRLSLPCSFENFCAICLRYSHLLNCGSDLLLRLRCNTFFILNAKTIGIHLELLTLHDAKHDL